MAQDKLTADDVKRLLADPSPGSRVETADKLSRQFAAGDLSDNERQVASEIFRIMVRDAEQRVREALSRNLKESALIPGDVAVTLARDVAGVALPMLEFSEVLTPEDLIEIVRGQDPEKQKAVAHRKSVDERVSDALVESGTAEVAAVLAANVGAAISESSMLKMVDKFGDVESVQGGLAHRALLPVTVAERLVHKVSENIKDHILRNHELPPDLAADLVMQSRERATIGLSSESNEDEVEALVRQMHEHGRLTPSIILRAVCMGDMKFFEYALSLRSGVPIISARVLVHDEGSLGLKGIYEKAGLPMSVFRAVRAAIDVADETDYDGEENDRERYMRRMIERVLTQYELVGVEFESDDIEYLLAKMKQLPSSAAV